jgi:signal transduction histidine kinase/DNA-binding response OmpR family regulator
MKSVKSRFFSGIGHRKKQMPLPGNISFFKLLLHLGAFIAGFVLLLGTHVFFQRLINDLNVLVVNEQDRLLIGELIVQNIQKVETDVYRMATTTGIKSQEIIRRDIDEQINALNEMLRVLVKGGTVKKQIRLNMQGRDQMIREISYQPRLHDETFILEVIDLAPKIGEIRKKITELAQLLELRESTRETGDIDLRIGVIGQVKNGLRIFYPMFVRLKENANRLFVKGNQRMLELESIIQKQQKFYYGFEISLVVLIFLSIIIFGYISARQIAQSNQQLHAAHDSMESAKLFAEKANAAKSEFLSSMSHELRTPLNAILGFTQLLELELGSNNAHSAKLREIRKAGKHLLSLINDVLDLAKVESGNLDYNMQQLVVEDVVMEAIQLLRHVDIQKSIEMRSENEAPGATIIADHVRIKQILVNLLSNGIKYNDEKGHVIIRIEKVLGERIRISVIDDGYGIDQNKYGELFKPFSRLGREVEEIEGNGIGLMLTKQLVENMGGILDFTSELGKGSKFWIEFDETDERLNVDRKATANINKNAGALSQVRLYLEQNYRNDANQKILLVEDNPTNQLLIEQQINALGYLVDIAQNGKQGLELMESGQYCLILTDCSMPIMDGYEMTKNIRNSEQESNRRIPIIAITANALQEDQERCLQSGMDDYLAKPVLLNDLNAIISKWLVNDVAEREDTDVNGATTLSHDSNEYQSKHGQLYINYNSLISLVGNQPLAHLEVLRKYIVEARGIVNSIKSITNDNAVVDIAYEAYRLKSLSIALGVMALVDMCEKLEATVESSQAEVKKELLGKIDNYLDQFDAYLNSKSQSDEM